MHESNDTLEIHTRRTIQATTLWLHGQGASSEDLIPIFKNLTDSRALGLRYVAPNAPLRRLTALGNRMGRAWYDGAAPDSDEPDPESLAETHTQLTALLDSEHRNAIPSSKTVIGGFSQGAALALYTGLQHPHALAGIVALSGELLNPDDLANRIHPANATTPILMIHGTEDAAVSLQEAEANRDRLRAQGLPVDWHTLALGHEISMDTIAIIDQWILARLQEQGVAASHEDQ